jgi:choline dehydrogenase-like flavoprotein
MVWVDRRGRVRVRYKLSAADRENLRAGVEATARLQLAAGAKEVLTIHTPPVRVTHERDLESIRSARYAPNRISLFSAHVNGTCRIGAHPASSGVTPDGERHGVAGLYVFDGSILPTSLGVNPQETIMALSSVLSERIQ